MLSIISSLAPLVLLAFKIENIFVLTFSILIFYLSNNLYVNMKINKVITSLFLFSLIALGLFLDLSVITLPYSLLLILFPILIMTTINAESLSPKKLLLLNLIVLFYIIFYISTNYESSFHARSVGILNGLQLNFAQNFGFGSPARAALVLTCFFYINFIFRKHISLLWSLTFLFLLIFTLNRYSILICTIFLLYHYKLLIPVMFIGILFSPFFIIKLDLLLPFSDRIFRIFNILNFSMTLESFDYKNFIETTTNHNFIRSSDFVLTPLTLNFGYFGMFLYGFFITLIILLTKKFKYALFPIIYFILISFKNFSFNIDVSLFFIFLISQISIKENLKKTIKQRTYK